MYSIVVFIVSVVVGVSIYMLGYREGMKTGKSIALSVQAEIRRRELEID